MIICDGFYEGRYQQHERYSGTVFLQILDKECLQ